MNKRGLSEVIVSIIMVLLVLVAIGIVWVVVKNALTSGTDQLSISRITIGLKIKNVVVDNVSNNVSITLKREVGEGDVSGIKFVVTDGINSQIFQDDSTLRELEEKKFTFHLSSLNADNVTQVSVVPILTTPSGKALSGMTYNYDVQEGTTTTIGTQSCTKNCLANTCSSDGCGGTCSCSSGYSCNQTSLICETTSQQCIDVDGDGYNTTTACGGSVDCDDDNVNVHPGATETCNGLDDDCDGQVDEGVTTTFYLDSDGDLYGNASTATQACSLIGYVNNSQDCNDANINVNPGATETCGNGIDENCNGMTDDSCVQYIKTWNGLVSWYRMNGDATDEMGRNPGTLKDANSSNSDGNTNATSTTGKFGSAYLFDGIDDYMDIGNSNSLKPTSEISVVAWINSRSNNAQNIIYAETPGTLPAYNLNVIGGSTRKLFFNVNGSNTNAYWTSQTWYHVAGTYNITNLSVSSNGIYSSNSSVSSITYNNRNITIGTKIAQVQPGYFNGTIDEVMIFNRSLSQAEITELYGMNLSA